VTQEGRGTLFSHVVHTKLYISTYHCLVFANASDENYKAAKYMPKNENPLGNHNIVVHYFGKDGRSINPKNHFQI
jgi:hypothetical protein